MAGEPLAQLLRWTEEFLADASINADILDEPSSDDPSYLSFWLRSRTGSLTGVLIPTALQGPPRRAALGDQVQEFIHEELAVSGRPVRWPECPAHPGSHPLAAVVSDGDAGWACPHTHEVLRSL
jgi:hypothetical protein